MAHPAYIPPPIEGYVNYSLFVNDTNNRAIPNNDLGRDYCRHKSADTLGIPFEDTLATRFTPLSPNAPEQWAVYVKIEHQNKVMNLINKLKYFFDTAGY